MLKSILKSKWFWLAIIIIIIVSGGLFYQWRGKQRQTAYTTETVKKGNLTQTVNATGAVEPAQDISLNFALAGRLNYLPVKEGQIVKAGQILARLNSGSIAAQVKQYQANLLSAQADLAKTKAGASAEDVKVTSEKAIKAANDLKNLEKESADQLQILREKTLDAINHAVFTSQIAIEVTSNHLISESNTYNLLFSNNNQKNKIIQNYEIINDEFIALKTLVSQTNQDKTASSIIIAGNETRNFLNGLKSFLSESYDLAKAIIVNLTYSSTIKDTIKSDIATEQTTANTSLTALETAKANLINNINSYETQLAALRDTLAISQSELDLKKAGPRDFEINSAEAKVAQAQAQLNKLLADLSDYQIIAPIDGIITKINYSLGEQTALSEPVIKMLSAGQFEVKVDIPESDIIKLKVGDQSMIELDAFGPDHLFQGTVTFIETAQTIIQDVTYYKTTVSFGPDEWNEKLKSGMTADVTIVAAEKTGILYVPQRAVKIKEAVLGEETEKFVEVLVNQKPQEKIITTGLRGDNGLVEITSGLAEGEAVIVFKKNDK
ncbi:MAG: efflux RND transporter periplasmic adaptor subunit [bacterium]